MSSPAPRVLVTRSLQQGSALAERLQALGADPVLVPAIEFAEPVSHAALDAALADLHQFHWLLFTSANAVNTFITRRRERVLPAHLQIAAIGPATARALEAHHLTASLIPPQAIGESLTEALVPLARQPDGTPTRFLLIRAEEAREHLPETLCAAGAEVTVAVAYRTVIPTTSVQLLQALFPAARVPSLRDSSPATPAAGASQGPIAAITFTSSSTARNLLALCGAAHVTLPEAALRISIGPITSDTLRELGLPPHAEASEATVAALAEAVMHALTHAASPQR